MRAAFVVIRYGLEVNGGAELEARLVAERLVRRGFEIDILTTCAVDLNTWANHYPAGRETLNGVPVLRFPVTHPRDMRAFNEYSRQIVFNPRTIYDEAQWMAIQGPYAPDMAAYIRDHANDYDLFVFYSYLYATTYWGLQLAPEKSILFPTAHDETWLYFDIFRAIFNLPRGLIFNSEEEARLVRQVFRNDHIPGIVLGIGLDDIESLTPPGVDVLPHDYIVYMGRVDEGKKCDEMFRHFLAYKRQTGDPVKLVLIGAQSIPLPDHPDIVALGFMKNERFAWLKRAQALILPSQFESLSLATLEAGALGVPVLVNGRCEVLKGHCRRGNGGLYYESEDEFVEALKLLRSDPALRKQIGQQGKMYVTSRYDWAAIESGYVQFLDAMNQLVKSDRLHH